MALSTQTMTDEQRKLVALEYLNAFDTGGVTSTGGSILDLFADDAILYFPKPGVARGREAIGKWIGHIGGTLKSIAHHPWEFNWIFTGRDQPRRAPRLVRQASPIGAAGRGLMSSRSATGRSSAASSTSIRKTLTRKDTQRYPWLAKSGEPAKT